MLKDKKKLQPGHKNASKKSIIWPWDIMSMAHEGCDDTWHIFIPYIISLCQRIKKCYSLDKVAWVYEQGPWEEEEILLEQYISLRWTYTM